MSAAHRGWGPAPVPRSKIVPVRAPLSGATFPGGVHRNIQELVTVLLDATERGGYRCVVGWCWGYAARRIGNDPSRPWSNHAWGLAVDINAPTNPYGRRLVTDMPDWMPAMWKACGFGWGGDYRSVKDAMHYEYMRRPENVAQDLATAVRYRDRIAGPQEDTLTDELRAYLQQMEARLNSRISAEVTAARESIKGGRNLARDLQLLRRSVRAVGAKLGLPTDHDAPPTIEV